MPGAACCAHGPGYATPLDAKNSGNREKFILVPCIVPDASRPDYLATVDVDPESDTYSQVGWYVMSGEGLADCGGAVHDKWSTAPTVVTPCRVGSANQVQGKLP